MVGMLYALLTEMPHHDNPQTRHFCHSNLPSWIKSTSYVMTRLEAPRPFRRVVFVLVTGSKGQR